MTEKRWLVCTGFWTMTLAFVCAACLLDGAPQAFFFVWAAVMWFNSARLTQAATGGK